MVDTTNPLFERIRLAGNPTAEPASIVIRGQARFSVLTSRLIRIEWGNQGQFEDRATFAFPNRCTETPVFTVESNGSQLEIRTDHLMLHYIENGQPFDAHNLSITLLDMLGEGG